jgi:hypothetical protein
VPIPLIPVLFTVMSQIAGDAPLAIPLKPDPPIAVDGDVGDWRSVPGKIALNAREQVVFGAPQWSGPADLSGTVSLSWREEALYIAADIVDDSLRQRGRGGEMWKGDNVMLFIDAAPNVEPTQTHFGKRQFQIAISPGSFEKTGDALLDVKPEVHCFQPTGTTLENARAAASRTSGGYIVEAAIPWANLGIANVGKGTPLRVEVALSDTDGNDAQQESLMTILSAAWSIDRTRLLAAALAGADGALVSATPSIPVFDRVELVRGAKQSYSFDVTELPTGLDAVLSIKARLQFDTVAGYNPALHLDLNGTAIDGARLINKPPRAKARGGDIYSMAAGELFSTYYAPDFTSPDTHPHYGLVDGYAACLFELRVTDLLKPGQNELIVTNSAGVDNPLIAGEASISYRPPAAARREKQGPPTGPLPKISPGTSFKTAYRVTELSKHAFELQIGDDAVTIESRFSTPRPGWTNESNEFFLHERRIEQRDEAVVVFDSFTNLTDQPLPLMHRHEARLGDRMKRLWLAGLDQPNKSGNVSNPSNPTLCAALEKTAIGMLPLDDVFRIHGSEYFVDGVAGIADNQLVLRPKAAYTIEWAVVPTPEPDYWTFLNSTRRLVGANFPIPGGFAFLRSGPLTDAWSDAQINDFIRFKDPMYVCTSNDYPRYNGQYTHGTSFQRVTHDNYRGSFARWRKIQPDRKYMVYFHCFIDVVEDGPHLFADSIHLDSNAKQADYGDSVNKLYIPIESNRFGPAIAKNVDIIFDEIGADGVYFDEHEYSRWLYHYGEPWDGFSGDIDPTSMKLVRKKSSTTLLTEKWRTALAKKILARGPLIGNGPPFTRAMAALKFPCFVETGSITHCAQSHLYSPIALGDHLTERNELDAYNWMLAALDFGCVYHWYNDMTVIPSHTQLAGYMFPITPLELHEGYIIGEERIITKKSGLYGWGDMSTHEVHVFNDSGVEVSDFQVPHVIEGGARYSEIRIGEGWSVAIVRK